MMSRVRFPLAAIVPVVALSLGFLVAGCGGPSDEGDPNQLEEELVSSSNQYAHGRPPPIVRELEEATEGLLFMSESDYPFEVLYWTRPGGSLTPERVAQLTGHVGETVEQRTLDDFFRAAQTPQEWQTVEELATVERYRALVKLLRAKLSFVRVYRFGLIQIHSYIVGVTNSGSWAGLSTIQIET
jgi:hypothetical protein